MPDCPICHKPAAPRAQNGAFPFCSDRCKKIDLGNWLDESYRVPGSAAEADESEDARAAQPNQEDA
jgi:endogenous inhibitor of DNA gyrase (YacG/DUF329 family)